MYIQSAFVLPDREKTRKEERPLVHIPDHFRKVIILGNDFQRGWIDDEGVQIISLRDFFDVHYQAVSYGDFNFSRKKSSTSARPFPK